MEVRGKRGENDSQLSTKEQIKGRETKRKPCAQKPLQLLFHFCVHLLREWGGRSPPSLCCHASVRSRLTLVRCDCRRPGKCHGTVCRVRTLLGRRRTRSNVFPPPFFLFIERLPRTKRPAKKKQRQSVNAAGCLPLARALKRRRRWRAPGVRHVRSGKVLV